MTYITNGDISITLSGGATNSSPSNSLGGEPSSFPITGERLFNDVSLEESVSGKEDYRCIYINNNSFTATLYAAKIFAEYKTESDVTVDLGFIEINEIQTITINGFNKITGGSFSITYSDYEGETDLIIPWGSTASILANNLQNALRSLERLKNIEVNPNLSNNKIILQIIFKGSAGKRYHEVIQEKSNNLILNNPNVGDGNINITRTVFGSPINSQAQEIDFPTTPPYGVYFNSYNTREASYQLDEIRPGDVVPVWIKRTVPPDSRGVESDGINIKIEGRILPITTTN